MLKMKSLQLVKGSEYIKVLVKIIYSRFYYFYYSYYYLYIIIIIVVVVAFH